jgi:hypothetical protein
LSKQKIQLDSVIKQQAELLKSEYKTEIESLEKAILDAK